MTEYWVVNLVDDVLEIFREPSSTGYGRRETFQRGDTANPRSAPAATPPLDELFDA